MARLTFFGLVVAILVPATQVFADFSSFRWPYLKTISAPNGELVRVRLESDVYARAKRDLSDLRVVDGGGRETPYQLVPVGIERTVRKVNLSLRNNSFLPRENSSVVAETSMSGAINEVRIITTSRNFRRNVTVSGSDDLHVWRTLVERAYIYDYTDERAGFSRSHTTVSFPTSTFRYLKISIDDPEGKPVVITALEGEERIASEIDRQLFPAAVSVVEDPERQETIVRLTKDPGVPVDQLTLGVKDDNFNRAVTIEESNDRGVTWRRVGQEYIFRYSTGRFFGSHLTLVFPEITTDVVRLRIHNKDSAPLLIEGAEFSATVRELVFPRGENETYALYYGNREAKQPQYDFADYFRYLDLSGAIVGELGAEQVNALYQAPIPDPGPLSERLPYLFPIALSLTALLMLFLLYRFYRRRD